MKNAETLVTDLAREYDELDKKLGRLETFIESAEFGDVSIDDRYDLCHQRNAMTDYLMALHRRRRRAEHRLRLEQTAKESLAADLAEMGVDA
jgi:hypothetical protein